MERGLAPRLTAENRLQAGAREPEPELSAVLAAQDGNVSQLAIDGRDVNLLGRDEVAAAQALAPRIKDLRLPRRDSSIMIKRHLSAPGVQCATGRGPACASTSVC
jgi:hypothetical protein